MEDTQTVRKMVFESCNNAIVNGYDELKTMSADKVALDMCYCDSSFEQIEVDVIEPFVKEWQESVVCEQRARWGHD